MPQDVQITQAQMLTYYSQHLSDIGEYVANCVLQVRGQLCIVSDNAHSKLYDIKRQKAYVEEILGQHKNYFAHLRTTYNFATEDQLLIDLDFGELEQEAKTLTMEAERLESLISSIESQVQMLEEQSKNVANSILSAINNAKSTIDTHSSNISEYIGGN